MGADRDALLMDAPVEWRPLAWPPVVDDDTQPMPAVVVPVEVEHVPAGEVEYVEPQPSLRPAVIVLLVVVLFGVARLAAALTVVPAAGA